MLHTFVEIKAYGDNAGAAISAAFDEMERVNRLLNNYDNTSEISAINKNAGGASVNISPETVEALQAALKFSSLSGGALDITVGPLLRLWGFAQEIPSTKGAGPHAEEIKKARLYVDYRSLELQQAVSGGAGTARLVKKGMWIDAGSFSKGYCADRAIAVLKKQGIRSALVAAGGTICAIGRKTDGSKWKVAVRHPRKDDNFMTFVPLCDASISTSGDYERFYEKNGRRKGHIIDPRTGNPVERMQSVSVIAATGLESDLLSTTLFVLGPAEGSRLMDSLPGTSALLVSHDGKISMSEKWPEKVILY
ncbi:MAG: FAD:protein FMN transferase [Deltaproteobacteria bacterium]|nr:FAD:protein FMN transferase [Deltaproteobacteria bacterium]